MHNFILFSLLFLAGCSTERLYTAPTRPRFNSDLAAMLANVYSEENSHAAELKITKRSGHDWNLAMMIRDEQKIRNVNRLKPLFYALYKNSGSEESFIRAVDEIVQKSGCSRAVISICSQYPFHNSFEFMDYLSSSLNMKYRYSQQVLDDRIMFR